MESVVQDLFHYPVKGLSGQSLPQVELQEGKGFPNDRAFGFARPDSGFDPENPAPLPKTKFVVLARDAALARLNTRFDSDAGLLALDGDGRHGSYDVMTATGREDAAHFIAQHLGMGTTDAPTLYSAAPHKFTDVSVVSPQLMNAVSLVNHDSVAAFSEMIGQTISPARFRGNIIFSGIAAFDELNWLGREITIGTARLKVVMRTKRCAATEVNLETGIRDISVPQLLHKHLGHFDMGVYAQVLKAGRIAPGDAINLND